MAQAIALSLMYSQQSGALPVSFALSPSAPSPSTLPSAARSPHAWILQQCSNWSPCLLTLLPAVHLGSAAGLISPWTTGSRSASSAWHEALPPGPIFITSFWTYLAKLFLPQTSPVFPVHSLPPSSDLPALPAAS